MFAEPLFVIITTAILSFLLPRMVSPRLRRGAGGEALLYIEILLNALDKPFYETADI